MKNLLVILSLTILPLFSFAQNQPIETFYNKYMQFSEVSNINLEGWLLQMVASYTDDSDSADLIEKITKLRVMIVDEKGLVAKSDKINLMKGLKKKGFEDLMQVRDGNSKIDFMLRESNKKITNVIMTVDDGDSFILLSLEGNMSWKDLKNLNIEVDGGEHLKNIPRA